MAKNPLEKFISQEKIAHFINEAQGNSSLSATFEHPLIQPIQDEHLRKVYLLLSFFAAGAFMQAGADENALLTKTFRIAATVSPNPLDAGEIKELMEQSIADVAHANKLNQYVQDLRQRDLTMPLLFNIFEMTEGESNSTYENLLLKFAEKFDLSATMRDVLNGITPQERINIFNEKLNEQQRAQSDEKRVAIRERGHRLEESLMDSPPKTRLTKLYLFYKENDLQEDMLNYSDALYRLAMEGNDTAEAIEWLLTSIKLNNSSDRRMQLFELYKQQTSGDQNSAEFAFQKMISEEIDGAKEDYEAYKQQKREQQRKKDKSLAVSSSSDSSGYGCAVIVLLVVAGVAWFFWPSSGGKQEKTEPPPKVEQQQKTEQQQQKQEEKTAAPIENPREASIKTFRAYHENLTKHDFQQAWACFDREMQDYFNYDSWVSGHQVTSKSNPYDIKVVSESPEKVILTYTLQTVDNPGGEKVFDGKAVIIKTENGWKINDVENALKQQTAPAPQKQENPPAPPASSPKPTPAAPPPSPAKLEIEYRTFTENWYGFSFEYPASEGDFPQADSRGGERAVEYWIDFPNGKVLMGAEFPWIDSPEGDMRDFAESKHSTDFQMLGANSYMLKWQEGNETVVRKTFLVPSRRKGSSGLVRQYIEIRSRGKLSAQNQEVAQHMMDSFQPGD